MASEFRVALSGEFILPDGAPAWPGFDEEPLRQHPGIHVTFLPRAEHLAPEHVEDVDAVILLHNVVDDATFHPNGRLSLVARFGAGYDAVDVAACTRHGVALVTTPEGPTRSMAVAILSLVFALAERLQVKTRLARMGPAGWEQKPSYIGRGEYFGIGLEGRVLGSIGLGRIGQELFRIAAPLGMTFLASDPYVDPTRALALGVDLVDLATLAERSDFLAVNCQLTARTHHLVDAALLARMRPTAYLINTARGPIVDQDALTSALVEGRIAGAGLDYLERIPAADDPILAMDDVIVAPVGLGWTDALSRGNGYGTTRAIIDVLHGSVPPGIINREVVDPAWQARLDRYREEHGPCSIGVPVR
jgi:phosphoglycerate dehydrogenase-like enzyme